MSARKLYDVSLTIYPGMLRWPGNPPVAIGTVKSIAQGDYELLCLPLKIKDADGAPACVFLREA